MNSLMILVGCDMMYHQQVTQIMLGYSLWFPNSQKMESLDFCLPMVHSQDEEMNTKSVENS